MASGRCKASLVRTRVRFPQRKVYTGAPFLHYDFPCVRIVSLLLVSFSSILMGAK
jgi:hypothetical protein